MTENEILGYPGRYILERVSLSGFSGNEIQIIDMVSEIRYVEDIFSPCVYGSCSVSDGVDLHQYLPICGEETLRLVYRSSPQDPEIDKTFKVYKVGEKQTLSNNLEGYVLYFCSEEMITDRHVKVSKSYKGYKTSEVIRDIVEGFLETEKQLETSDTIESLHLIIPTQSPFEAIQFCSSISRSTVSNGSLFVFYEDRDGFKFSNLEELMAENPILDSPVPVLLQNINSESEQLFPSTSLAAYTITNASKDILNSMMDGTFANQVLSYDPLTKTFTKTEYSYDQDFDETLHLDTERLVSPEYNLLNPEQRISVVSSQFARRESNYYKSKSDELLLPAHEGIISKRTAQLGQLDSIIIKGTLYGLTRATCGKTILVDIPNHTSLENKKTNPNHKYLSGKYLITNVTHVLTPGTYMVDVCLMKDTLNTELEYDLD